ncbi:competence type IV pilus major pilin ComGC [Bacillus carboniphilus]|uniref:ComG operon protein 3 n=1 Tax=Bacillus carboniphilus TaxID=86663 RepID=A0ABY9K2Z7_9BACI|nr:competence type IV pilus major pilin ComGC [Bacillus carboniphilus]WLR44281.1 competence type IV pilus major pilin ComGC [Bacillus carboniphilus]
MDERGFTLIEMLVVLLVISILLIMTIPNITKHNQNIQKKGCEGLVNMVQAQVVAYDMENDQVPTLEQLITGGYITDNASCPDGSSIVVNEDGSVESQ